ncbi:ABC transporter substrate-binding protein [Paracoccus sp. N5]|uniref:ABC transporter substrate-binding protein n=1 Tax=Paracoccus sp. N5 TaxID=1101189 RepID=UPI000476608F|nr:ABC transporter substrate-binding protein [Paracoccus sp. N5]
MVAARAPGLGRRAFLCSVAALAAAGPAFAQQSLRLAAIDWAMMETAVALGHMPVAACELVRYRQDTTEPRIPASVTDLGLRGAPNYELLQLMRPDLILSSTFYPAHEAQLSRIAPVLSLPFYIPGEPPLPKALAALADLAARIGDAPAGRTAQMEAEARLDVLAARLAGFRDRPVALIDIGDARHLRAFGYDSMFGNVLERLGLGNAWTERTAFSFRAPLPLERLAAMPEARLVIVGEIPVEARTGLRRSILWQALPPVAQGRLYRIPAVNAFGGTPSALHFAELLAQAFQTGPAAT